MAYAIWVISDANYLQVPINGRMTDESADQKSGLRAGAAEQVFSPAYVGTINKQLTLQMMKNSMDDYTCFKDSMDDFMDWVSFFSAKENRF